MHDLRALLALPIAGLLAGCTPGVSADDDDDDAGWTLPEGACLGDRQLDGVPMSEDMDALADRFDVNKELLRILFVGEPQ